MSITKIRDKSRCTEPPRPADLLVADGSLRALASRLRSGMGVLRQSQETEDLVQEAYLKALLKLDSFQGRSTLKTWAISVARNHLLSMARAARLRPTAVSDLDRDVQDLDSCHREELRASTHELLAWLKKNPGEVEWGWEALNLLLWAQGDCTRVAVSLSIHTQEPWTAERVRNVIRSIRKTPKGRSLCEALGLEEEE